MICCWRCGGEVVLEADECGDTCDGCIEEEVREARLEREGYGYGSFGDETDFVAAAQGSTCDPVARLEEFNELAEADRDASEKFGAARPGVGEDME